MGGAGSSAEPEFILPQRSGGVLRLPFSKCICCKCKSPREGEETSVKYNVLSSAICSVSVIRGTGEMMLEDLHSTESKETGSH